MQMIYKNFAFCVLGSKQGLRGRKEEEEDNKKRRRGKRVLKQGEGIYSMFPQSLDRLVLSTMPRSNS